jgi:hypothetical protein
MSLKNELIKASNALHTCFIIDLRPYRKHGYVKHVMNAKADFQLPMRCD